MKEQTKGIDISLKSVASLSSASLCHYKVNSAMNCFWIVDKLGNSEFKISSTYLHLIKHQSPLTLR
jgi:hypothetical protein